MKFGLARVCITPGFRTCLACSQQKDTLFESVHDDIFVGCAVLDDDNEKLMILSYDLLFHSRDLHEFVYEYSIGKYGLKNESILINFTHDHNSPSTLGYNDFSASAEYEELLKEKTLEAIDTAFGSLETGTMEYGEIPGHWAINRRKSSPDGIKLAPNPDGPVDDRIYLLKLTSASGKTKGLVINYACHPVHYPDPLALTSEYPGFLCEYIENMIPGCIPLFIQGAGANARPAGTAEGDRFVHRSFSHISDMASEMGKAIIDSLNSGISEKKDPEFFSASFEIRIPTEDEGRDYFIDRSNDISLSAHLRRNAVTMVSDYDGIEDAFTLNLGIMKLSSDLVILHMGGEPCCEVKFNLMDIFKGFHVIFAGYTDGCSYIVTDELIAKGGYEVNCFLEYMHKGRIKSGIDKILHDACSEAFAIIIS
ncbi:MAG TPA: hypothetical protein PLP30_05875 [Clostridia bacterium]|nr:hypothetical protein [Clostridia bacterium]HPQ46875.1 hypothetical protein [Clostridia bacterium]HRX43017.1 hypothetical protein [Clostridia bacterium]